MKERLFWGNRRVMLLHKRNLKILLINLITMFVIIFAVTNFIIIYNYPNEINLMQGHSQKLENAFLCKLVPDDRNQDSINLRKLDKVLTSFTLIQANSEGRTNTQLKVLNLFPVKEVTVNVIPDRKVVPSGEAIGVKIQTKGVLVVGLSSITSPDGKKHSPAADAGFEVGDLIIEINDKKIEKERDITNIVNEEIDKALNFLVERSGKQLRLNVKPIQSIDDDIYRVGLWVRDSIAGVGTMTFYDPQTRAFGALGHGITDVDSGVLVDISKGTILKSKVASVQKARKTVPGEIVGIFYDSDEPYGTIAKNTSYGIYGKINDSSRAGHKKAMPIALSYQVKEGPAKIITTVDGNKAEEFNIEIQKVNRQSSAGSKSMMIKITDQRLLEITGGIVQGMSGSPIIQDGRIVGAVTHVLVNDPTRGYGIFIEWMLEEADVQLESVVNAAAGQ